MTKAQASQAKVQARMKAQAQVQTRVRTKARTKAQTEALSPLYLDRLETLKDKVYSYAAAHYRAFDWRDTQDPYAIWISEVMLQQTQTQRVVARFQEWMERFPTVDELALASTADCLGAWQGMGYNRRALMLLKTSQIVSKNGGVFPQTEAELTALPGIGPATAAGICAFAYNQHTIYIETNVRSVFLHELMFDRERPQDRELMPYVSRACPPSAAADSRELDTPRMWYYALLDYGNYLKKTLPNPSRRSGAYVKQSRFEGSRRQKRSCLVRILLACDLSDEIMDVDALTHELNLYEQAHARPLCDQTLVQELMEELTREGFCAQVGLGWRIASS